MPIRPLIVFVLTLAMLAGCGRRGDLEPAGTPETNAVPSPDASIAAAAATSPGTVETPRVTPKRAPNRPFFLDPLL
jgi:hypothetical protein